MNNIKELLVKIYPALDKACDPCDCKDKDNCRILKADALRKEVLKYIAGEPIKVLDYDDQEVTELKEEINRLKHAINYIGDDYDDLSEKYDKIENLLKTSVTRMQSVTILKRAYENTKVLYSNKKHIKAIEDLYDFQIEVEKHLRGEL